MPSKAKRRKWPGPVAEHLAVKGPWRGAVRDFLKAKPKKASDAGKSGSSESGEKKP